jgi:hypothetical protein
MSPLPFLLWCVSCSVCPRARCPAGGCLLQHRHRHVAQVEVVFATGRAGFVQQVPGFVVQVARGDSRILLGGTLPQRIQAVSGGICLHHAPARVIDKTVQAVAGDVAGGVVLVGLRRRAGDGLQLVAGWVDAIGVGAAADDEPGAVAVGVILVALVGIRGGVAGQAVQRIVAQGLRGDRVADAGEASGGVVAQRPDAGGTQRVAGQAVVGVEAAAIGGAIAEGPRFDDAEGLVLDITQQRRGINVNTADATLGVSVAHHLIVRVGELGELAGAGVIAVLQAVESLRFADDVAVGIVLVAGGAAAVLQLSEPPHAINALVVGVVCLAAVLVGDGGEAVQGVVLAVVCCLASVLLPRLPAAS